MQDGIRDLLPCSPCVMVSLVDHKGKSPQAGEILWCRFTIWRLDRRVCRTARAAAELAPRNHPGSALLHRFCPAVARSFWGTCACLGAQPLQIKIGYLHEVPSKNRISVNGGEDLGQRGGVKAGE